jgi:hypothetical protein
MSAPSRRPHRPCRAATSKTVRHASPLFRSSSPAGGDPRAMRQMIKISSTRCLPFSTFRLIDLDCSPLPCCNAAFGNPCVGLKRSHWRAETYSANCKSRDIGPALRASRPEALNRKRPKERYLMDKNTETTATKPAGFPNGPEAIRDMAEKGKPKKLTRK